MATIYNSEVIKEIIDGAGIQINKDNVPIQLAEKVVPVMEINPNLLRRCKVLAMLSSLTNATSATIYTTPTDKDTYIVSGSISMIKDATATATDMALKCFPDDSSNAYHIIRLAGITLTADAQTIVFNLSMPMKIKRGTSITLTSDTATATIIMRASLMGYETLGLS